MELLMQRSPVFLLIQPRYAPGLISLATPGYSSSPVNSLGDDHSRSHSGTDLLGGQVARSEIRPREETETHFHWLALQVCFKS